MSFQEAYLLVMQELVALHLNGETRAEKALIDLMRIPDGGYFEDLHHFLSIHGMESRMLDTLHTTLWNMGIL